MSKQFQRTVFQKHFILSLELYDEKFAETEDRETNPLKSIESLLKNCPNIKKMRLFFRNNRIFESIVPLITKYCDNLNEFNVSLDDMTEPELNEEFLQKFGSKLKYISCGEYLDLNLFPNLDRFSISPGSTSLERLVGLNFRNLNELNVIFFEETEHFFLEVLQKFHKIRRLTLNVYTDKEKSFFDAFNESPVLQNLIELKYNKISLENANQFLDSLKQLAEKLPKLKSIEIESVYVKDISDLRQHLSPLKAFPELKRLDLELTFLKPQNVSEISLKPFQDLQNITHLSLLLNVRQMNWKILKNIDIYLPKLQYLCIRTEFIVDEEGVKQMAESLSRLSSLQTIELKLNGGPISELMIAKIAEKCRKIRKIDLIDLF